MSTANPDEALRAKINGETARIDWRSLMPHFARGEVLHVAASLDLVDVAATMHADDAVAVKAWMDAGQLVQVADDTARQWFEQDADVWALVIKPWILVQAERAPN